MKHSLQGKWTVFLLPLLINLLVIDTVVWQYRYSWDGMVLKGFNFFFSAVILSCVTGVSAAWTWWAWTRLADRQVSAPSVLGAILSILPLVSGIATEIAFIRFFDFPG